MKICIISDLHCKYQHDIMAPSDSFLFSNMPRKPIFQHPVVAMLKAIEQDESIKSDILLCLGDLGDKANEQGIISAWSFIEEISQKLESKVKIGIPGNHDINSRSQDGKDVFTFIKNFHENYPTANSALNDKLWSKGYCIVIHENILILLLNTVHDHSDAEKAKSSQIKVETLEEIRNDISEIKSTITKKICILHHHPIKHSNINNYRDSDSLEKGDDLIDILATLNFDIIIHGHKHQPRIVEYNGVTIFGTGSFSSFANLQGTGFNTMFHVVDLVDGKNFGKIYSWEFNIKDGWKKAYNTNFPYQIGFGANIDESAVASLINDKVQEAGGPIFYKSILEIQPELEYLTPAKLIQIGEILKHKYKIFPNPEFPLIPSIIIPI